MSDKKDSIEERHERMKSMQVWESTLGDARQAHIDRGALLVERERLKEIIRLMYIGDPNGSILADLLFEEAGWGLQQ